MHTKQLIQWHLKVMRPITTSHLSLHSFWTTTFTISHFGSTQESLYLLWIRMHTKRLIHRHLKVMRPITTSHLSLHSFCTTTFTISHFGSTQESFYVLWIWMHTKRLIQWHPKWSGQSQHPTYHCILFGPPLLQLAILGPHKNHSTPSLVHQYNIVVVICRFRSFYLITTC